MQKFSLFCDELLGALGFFSRFPLPAPRDFRRALRLAPLAGLVLGAGAGALFFAAQKLGLPPMAAALLALASLALATGALHEDGLADIADGFGGGFSRERKLEIMKDSRIGAFGASALILSFGLRAAALAALPAASGFAALAGSGGFSRAMALVPLILLPPARDHGAGQAAGGQNRDLLPALPLSLPIGLIPLLSGAPLSSCLVAVVLAGLATLGLCALAKTQIGGQTGDVAGAAQQIAEIFYLLTLAAR